jgi:hypothetical protein
MLAQADGGRGCGNARCLVLDQATASQAHRPTTASLPRDPAALSTIRTTDMPEHIISRSLRRNDELPAQYL